MKRAATGAAGREVRGRGRRPNWTAQPTKMHVVAIGNHATLLRIRYLGFRCEIDTRREHLAALEHVVRPGRRFLLPFYVEYILSPVSFGAAAPSSIAIVLWPSALLLLLLHSGQTHNVVPIAIWTGNPGNKGAAAAASPALPLCLSLARLVLLGLILLRLGTDRTRTMVGRSVGRSVEQ